MFLVIYEIPVPVFDHVTIYAYLLTQFDIGYFWAPHHNFVVIAPMIMKFGTGINLDVFDTMVRKNCEVTTIT